jgi:hypothetical protein
LPCRKAGCSCARGDAHAQSLGRILDYPTKPFCKRGRIVRAHEDASAVWDRLRYRACAGADHRKASGDGFGISHTVALETRGKDKHIGRDVKLGKMMRRHLTDNGNSIVEPMKRDIGIKLSGRLSVTRAIAGNRQMPRRFSNRSKGSDQNVKTFPWHDRSD